MPPAVQSTCSITPPAAWTVLQKAIEKDGAVLPDGAAGDQIRRAVGIMDGPVTEALQLGAAQEALELWWVHTEHINRVFENGGKGRGCQNATYHPKLMNWAIAFLARTSSGTYNKVAKIFMLPHISTLIAVDCGDDLLCNSRRWDHAQPEQQRHV